MPVLPKCIPLLPSYGPPPTPPPPTFRRKPGSLLNACVFHPSPFSLSNSFHMSVALCEKEPVWVSLFHSAFPNFMNNLTMRSIRPWDPGPRRVAESPSGVQPSFAQTKRWGTPPQNRQVCLNRPAAWSNSADIFPSLRSMMLSGFSKWLFCHLQQKQNKLLLFRSWDPSKETGHSRFIRCTWTITAGL